jgi:Uma2 family endonuclease
MAALTGKKLMTAEEFFEFANQTENRDRQFELERGEVVEMSRPGERHGCVCVNVGSFLHNYARQRRRGYACSNDTGLILERGPDTVRGPDLMFYDEVRRYDELQVRYSDRVPTLTVEVLSPNDRFSKVMRRIATFLARGVGLVWLVDPEDRCVTVYRPNQLPQVLEGNDELTGDGLLPDLRCRVAEFFYLPGEEAPSEEPAKQPS